MTINAFKCLLCGKKNATTSYFASCAECRLRVDIFEESSLPFTRAEIKLPDRISVYGEAPMLKAPRAP